jgi:hypothetical protein
MVQQPIQTMIAGALILSVSGNAIYDFLKGLWHTP